MRIVPGSHLKGSLEHKDTFSKNNLLTRGQEISVEVDEKEAKDIILSPGQMSLHHVSLVHGSDPNTSSIDRIGFAIRYISTHVKQNGGRTSATLAKGTDEYNHFDLEPYPESELAITSKNYREKALKRQHEILYRGAR
jgi:ectoine hydroxylase-related dioxygenase (phytanoyl-CoA dioxygenase family)